MTGIDNILKKVQISKAAHQKQLKILRMHYDKIPPEDFFEKIRIVLRKIFSVNTICQKNSYVENTLDFLAQFVADVTPEGINDDILDECTHPFLTMIIKDTLKYHNLTNDYLRYNSCLFVRLVLQYIGSNKNLDNEVCDLIEEAMLERTLDPKPTVRLQAVLALIRLQDPMNAESPVNKAYLSLIVDANVQIRGEVVKNIAPYNVSVPQIVNRLRDIDSNVRVTAFRRCADLGPRYFKILERQHILTCGLTESHQKVKNVFIENLLPKWLNAYENNYITFFNALKLDADENDIVNTEKITTDVLNLLLRSTPINQITSILPLDDNKIIPFDKLESEVVAIWNILIHYLRENENMEEYLEDIIPDLTPFCQYIESLVFEKRKNKMEDWEFLDYQYILNNLLGIAESYDFSDEVGRRTLHQFAIKLLREENLLFKLKERTVVLAAKTAQKTDCFTSTICYVISELQEPLVEKPVEVDPNEDTNKECQKADLKVKIIVLETKLEEATDNQEYLKANAFKNEISDLKQKLQDLSVVKPSTETVKVIKDDPKTICDCLDILICMLSLPTVNTMTPSLITVKDEFVVPLLNSNVSEINWRVIKCIALFCILEESLAEEYLKVLCIPIITYRAIPNYNKQALMIAVRAIPDMFRLYGANVFGSMENAIGHSSNQTLNSTTSNKRRLYHTEESDENIDFSNKFHLESIIEVILDMLDDENGEIRNTAIEAISKLILNQFPVSSLLISRLILKWYNPLTAQASEKSQQLIGVVITNFARSSEGAKEVIAKAVVPTLQSIARAPRASPLADVDVDNLLLFISTVTDCEEKIDVSNTHINMAHMFTSEILKKKNDAIAVYLSKLLLYLNIHSESVATINELRAQVLTALEDENLSEKVLKKNLIKLQEKLNALLENYNRTQDTNFDLTENSNVAAIIDEKQENSTNSNNRTIATNNRNHEMPSIREVEEDIFESSTDSNISATNKVPEEEATIETSSNTRNVNNAKKRNRENEQNNKENIIDSTDNEESQQISKKLKVPVVVLNKCEINQVMTTNKDNDEVPSQSLSQNKESEINDTNSGDNFISGTSEDSIVSKNKNRKRSRTQESGNDSLSNVNILQVITIKPQIENPTSHTKSKRSKGGETSSDSSISKNTRNSINVRLKAANQSSEENDKRMDRKSRFSKRNHVRNSIGKNLNDIDTAKSTSGSSFEDAGNRKIVKNQRKRLIKSNKNNKEKIETSISKTEKKLNINYSTSDETSGNEESRIRRSQRISSNIQQVSVEDVQKVQPNETNTQTRIQQKKLKYKEQTIEQSDSSTSDEEYIHSKKIKNAKKLQQANNNSSTTNETNSDCTNSERQKSKRLQVRISPVRVKVQQTTSSSSSTHKTISDRREGLGDRKKSRDTQTRQYTPRDKRTSENNKNDSAADKINVDCERNKLTELSIEVSPVRKTKNKNFTSQRADSDTSNIKETTRKTKTLTTDQGQTRKNSEPENNQDKLLTSKYNTRKRKKMLAPLGNLTLTSKRMRLVDKVNKNDCKANKNEESDSNKYVSRDFRQEINKPRLTSNKTLPTNKKSTSESSELNTTKSSSSSLHTILSDFSQKRKRRKVKKHN